MQTQILLSTTARANLEYLVREPCYLNLFVRRRSTCSTRSYHRLESSPRFDYEYLFWNYNVCYDDSVARNNFDELIKH